MTDKLLVGMQSGGGWYDHDNDELGMKRAKDCGIEAIDYGMDRYFSPDKFKNGKRFPLCDLPLEDFVKHFEPLKKASEKYGVKIAQVHGPFPNYHVGFDQLNEYLHTLNEKVIATCAYLGCKELVVHPFETIHRYKDFVNQFDIDINLEMYKKLIPTAKKYGVKICLENLQAVNEKDEIVPGICADYNEAIYLVDTLNAVAGENIFSFCCDIGHLTSCKKDIYTFITKLGNRISSLHIHDSNGGDPHLIPYSQVKDDWGLELVIDWDKFLLALKEINYQGCLSFETFRAIRHLPNECTDEALKLISSIGRYFRKKILE